MGITPAHAGKSLKLYVVCVCAQDHPRPCGEKIMRCSDYRSLPGSPPPMRGKAHRPPFGAPRAGITPAHAGKSCHSHKKRTAPKDHPRPCGEKFRLLQRLYPISGSPPPMRGKGRGLRSVLVRFGITPAHAGKRICPLLAVYFATDHPRPCGEKLGAFLSALRGTGSPPPMRGKAAQLPSAPGFARITPAHAGKRHKLRLPA